MPRFPMRSPFIAARAAGAATLSLLLAFPAGASELWTTAGSKAATAIALPSLAPLVGEVEPAVMVVLTESSRKRRLPPGHPGMPHGRGEKAQGQGTGFLIHPSGYALTNQHVVEGAERITVRVGGSREEVEAEIIGADAATDVALIKLKSDRNDWPVIPLGDSAKERVGDFVVAIGNPFGLELSVSTGILSARGRRSITPSGRVGLYDFLQTDASINPGNSGGPLLNLRGEVIGINSAVNAAGQGIGFAIPVNLVKRILPELKEKGRVARAWLGVSFGDLTPKLAKSFGLRAPVGALVREVLPESPADQAGIEPGDVILRVGEEAIERADELPLRIGLAGVGKQVKLRVRRDGGERTLTVKLRERPGTQVSARAGQQRKQGAIGLSVSRLDGASRRRLGFSKRVKGALVHEVDRGSPAARAGLRKDDVIIKVNGHVVKDERGLGRHLKSGASGDVMRLTVKRGKSSLFMVLELP